MNNKEMGVLLINELKEILAPFDFKFQAKRRAFVKKSDSENCIFHLAFIQHVNNFDVVVDLGIRLNAVHELADQKGVSLGDATFGIEIGNYAGASQKRWSVDSAESIPIAVAGIEKVFRQTALPYFEKYSNLQNALYLIESTGSEHSPIAAKRELVLKSLRRIVLENAS